MEAPWTIMFWLQIWLKRERPNGFGIIASYNDVIVFLRTADYTMGISSEGNAFVGPKITGLERNPWLFIGLTKDQSRIALYLNGEWVMEIHEGQILFKIEDFHVKTGNKTHIKIIKQDLSRWIEKRKLLFKMQRNTADKYLILGAKEQEKQLEVRVQALGELVYGFHHGKRYFFEDIVANLRASVFYKSKSGTYDPLLLRIAAFKGITLPVYVIPDDDNRVKILSKTRHENPHFWRFDFARFEPEIPCVKMVDLQEFLEKPAMLYQGEFISPLALIEKIGTTQSTAHLDQRIPHVIQDLKDTPVVFGYNSLEYYVISMADLIVKVANFVLSA
jgi:hypothetical protein